MKKVLLSTLLSVFTISTLSLPVLATETNGISVTNSSTSATADFMKHLYVNYFATFHGTPLSDMGASYTLDHNGKETKNSFNMINFDSDLTTAYMLSSDVGIGPDVPFLFVPVQGQGMILGDVGIKTFNKHLVSGGGFNLSGNLYLQAPTSKASRDRSLDFGLKTTPAIRYAIPSSKFTIGSWNEAKWYAGVNAGKTFKLYTQPYVNYSLNQSFSLNLGYEMETDHMFGKPTLDFTSYQTDLQPGFVWMITPKVMVNPYMQLFTLDRVSSEKMAFGAVISATML